jgi:acyl-coenzyme A synthetase/AMP-(fatty) acid ligase
MLGYVSDSSRLGRFEPINWLKTGDLAEFDDEGRIKLVGRKSRFLKLLGFRVDLDAIENSLQEAGIVAYCSGNDQCLVVAVQLSDLEFTQRRKEVHLMISKLIDVHYSIIKLINLSELPLTGNGKKDYPAIVKLALQSN